MTNTLMVSVSGVRGIVGKDLTPELVSRYAAAFGSWARGAEPGRATIVVGRDARTSGDMLSRSAIAGLLSVGCDVVDVGIVPTPTVQIEVERRRAQGGLIVTASHNPIEWNALKFVGPDGIFLDADAGAVVQSLLAQNNLPRAGWDEIGNACSADDAIGHHLDLAVSVVDDVDQIRERGYTVALDCVRGAGGGIMPQLLERLGCQVIGLNLATDGRFPREPEPVAENLGELCDAVRRHGADLGLAVDPDVDRLAVVSNRGEAIGEDYTLAFAVRSVLCDRPETTGAEVVCNLSTSMVVEDAARACGARVTRTPVGEAHVARCIMNRGATIGGEGNGGVIYPRVHPGRDAPVAAALVLQLLARFGRTVSDLVTAQPQYVIVKAKAPRGADLTPVYTALQGHFRDAEVDMTDGLRLTWPDRWVHIRPSGTEPIVRLIAEAGDRQTATHLIDECRASLVEGAT